MSIFRLTNTPDPKPINVDFYEIIDLFQVPGIEVFRNQFPFNLVSTKAEIGAILTRAKSWEKRMNGFQVEAGEAPEVFTFWDDVYRQFNRLP